MATTPEGRVKQRVKEMLNQYKDALYWFMPVGSGFGNSGVPDFIVCFQGLFIGIETKANGGQPTALQKAHMARIETAKGLAIVIDETNVSELFSILEWWRTAKRGV